MTLPELSTQHTPPPTPPPLPPSNVGWAVAAVVFFWPLAFAAFSDALKVFPRWCSGDLAGARAASRRARTLGIIALSIGVLSTALCLSSAFT
ncbi:CD225/dispanin family protein [Rhodococcus sp. NPDC127530]|jgi:Interferon-induced transmembrane protein|uniref:CD225/dispanin family protein n=1 Tax=unclassified Rhodococcus (in: high G+C Gram-positive bacteria) TaxID=192944 RepID=UPI003634382F